jgi:drug/metabolite transporter (DMT)-like permease
VTIGYTLAALAAVLAISAGQILFKLAALAMPPQASGIPAAAWAYGATGVAIYGLATIGWIWLLRHVPLNLAYPLMALAFVIVPVGSALILGEALAARTLIGAAVIVAGVVISSL